MTPADLPWWTWLLIALGSGLVYAISRAMFEERTKRGVGFSGPIAFISAVAGILSGVVAVIRFVKWVWVG